MSTCRTLVVVHGKSELIFCKGIASKLRINMEYDSNDKGETCIQIPHLEERFCTGPFKSENSLHKKFGKLEYLGRETVKMPHLMIFSIMDTDDNSMEKSYRTGNMFHSSAFWGRIVPIFNTPNMDAVFNECGFEIDRNNKVRSYSKLVNDIGLSEIIDTLKDSDNTNLCIFLNYCASITPSFQDSEDWQKRL